jgi:RNA polymerase sigma factor (sigma-70 family)
MSPRVSLRLLASQSDRRLLELVERGHERAFEALVLRYRKPLLAYCTRLGLTDARAEDVVQQSLLKAWLALAGGVQVRELRAWLYRIVHNTAVNALRSQPAEGTHALHDSRAHAPASDDELERSLAARKALSDVAELPPMQRDAILLSAVEGRSHDEVASTLGVTSTAARGLIYRARAALRSAAAALTPPWMLHWASGGANRVAPNAARLGELYAAAGTDPGTAVLKGAALAVTAALAAGAAIGPLGPMRHRNGRQRDNDGVQHVAVAGLATAAGARDAAAASGHGDPAAVVDAVRTASSRGSGSGRSQPPTARAYSRAPVALHRSPTLTGTGETRTPSASSPTPGPAATASSSSSPTATPSSGSGEPATGAPGAQPSAEKPDEKPVVKAPGVEKEPEEPTDDGGAPEQVPPPPIRPVEAEPKLDD